MMASPNHSTVSAAAEDFRSFNFQNKRVAQGSGALFNLDLEPLPAGVRREGRMGKTRKAEVIVLLIRSDAVEVLCV